MKNLVVYYSRTGNNKVFAHYLSNKLNADISEIDIGKKYGVFRTVLSQIFKWSPDFKMVPDVDLKNYDKVIIIGPVWLGNFAGAIRSFIIKYRTELKKIIIVSLHGGESNPNVKDPQNPPASLEKMIGVKPDYFGELLLAPAYPGISVMEMIKIKIDEKIFQEKYAKQADEIAKEILNIK